MQYIIHVIDSSSNYEKNEKKFFQISLGNTNKNEPCHILQSDAFYKIESESIVKAVEELTRIIRIENSDGEKIFLSEALKDTKEKQENTDLDSYLIIEQDIKKSNNPYFVVIELPCQIENQIGEERWIEYHKIQFFVVEESKIMEIVN